MIWRTDIDILMLGKRYPLSQVREHDENKIIYAEHYRGSDNLILTSTFKQCILTISQYKEYYLIEYVNYNSVMNKILIDQSMLERYKKYKCCLFIDFEYMMFSLLNKLHFNSNSLVEQMIKILEKDALFIIKDPVSVLHLITTALFNHLRIPSVLYSINHHSVLIIKKRLF